MARSPRTVPNAHAGPSTTITSTPTSLPTPSSSIISTPINPHSTRTRSRTSQIIAKSSPLTSTPTQVPIAKSTPSTPILLTPITAFAETPIQAGSSSTPGGNGCTTAVEPKTHALRSVLGEKDRASCPFPGKYGGREKLGVSEEDERDEVLMAVCAAIADSDNRALSPDEIASISFENAWLRPPSAAIEPSTVINNSIRAHQKRCTSTAPARRCLLSKYQLTGGVNESVLESALHPSAFEGGARPKGTVWFLTPHGKGSRWKNPFDGLEVPRGVPRRSVTKKIAPKKVTSDVKAKTVVATSKPPSAPVKLRLVLGSSTGAANPIVNSTGAGDEGDESEAGSSSTGSRRRGSATPIPSSVVSLSGSISMKKMSRRRENILDSDSDTSDSDLDMDTDMDGPILPIGLGVGGIKLRKAPPAPLHLASRGLASPFTELFSPILPTPVLPQHPTPQLHTSPFPTHSLDNTTWAVRHERDRFSHEFETSSSSSDEEVRDGDWGVGSDVLLVRGVVDDGMELGEDGLDHGATAGKTRWSAEDEEAKVKEATDALRVLFPMTTRSPEEELDAFSPPPPVELNRLDYGRSSKPTPSDTSSIAESASTTTATATQGRMGFRTQTTHDIPLTPYSYPHTIVSSPVASPEMRQGFTELPHGSPSQHLTSLRESFESGDMSMEVDMDVVGPWMDESGELPVKAEDSLSDIDLGSNIGDVGGMGSGEGERDRHLHTAAWAAGLQFRVGREKVDEGDSDYPSPLTDMDRDVDEREFRGDGDHGSRASSESRTTPSSRDSEVGFAGGVLVGSLLNAMDVDEVVLGPESIRVEDIDGDESWLATFGKEKTPRRGRGGRKVIYPSPRVLDGNWGGIGVGMPCTPGFGTMEESVSPLPPTPSVIRMKSSRKSSSRRRSSAAVPVIKDGDDADTEMDVVKPEKDEVKLEKVDMSMEMDGAIGPDDFAAACAEAEAREEEHRKFCRAKVEAQRLALEDYRERVKSSNGDALSPPSSGIDIKSPWSDGGNAGGLSANGALSPLVLQSVSALSLGGGGTCSGSMNPKVLLSPPAMPLGSSLGSSVGMSTSGLMDEVLSQKEVEEVMSGVRESGYLGNIPHLPPSAASSHINVAANVIKKASAPTLAPPRKVAPNVLSPTKKALLEKVNLAAPAGSLPIPIPSKNATIKTNAHVPMITTEPLKSSIPLIPKIETTSTSPTATSATSSSSTVSASGSITANPNSQLPIAKPANGVSLFRAGHSTTKQLFPGIEACVVDNIPVYCHITTGKIPGIVVLRRLDTDFVNASSLLTALGLPTSKHHEYLNTPSPWQSKQYVAPTTSDTGALHAPGVPGVWVHYEDALEFAKRLPFKEGDRLSRILGNDLFQRFALLANLKNDHAVGVEFGLPFAVQSSPDPNDPKARQPSPNTLISNTLQPNALNSKSTPNLSALSTSAPAQPTQPHTRNSTLPYAKGPLVRPAPAAQPDGCPTNKRRRATIVGGMSPMLTKLAGVAPLTPAAGVKKAAPRATRQSVGGDVPRPKVTK